MGDFFSHKGERRTRLHTGPGGATLYYEAVDFHLGVGRIYLGRKVSRIVRRLYKAPNDVFFVRYKLKQHAIAS